MNGDTIGGRAVVPFFIFLSFFYRFPPFPYFLPQAAMMAAWVS
jgi:hypothetical protein